MKITKPLSIVATIALIFSGLSQVQAAHSAAVVTGTSTLKQSGTVSVTPSVTEGPYYLEGDFKRRDIRLGQKGLLQEITLLVTDTNRKPIANAKVDLWHTNALGKYSGVQGNTDTFLRGSQTTNSKGYVTFKTIFTGWYSGRTVHYHLKVWRGDKEALSTQLLVSKADADKVYSSYEPYIERGKQSVTNETDRIVSGLPLSKLMLKNKFSANKVVSKMTIVIGN